MVGNLANAVIIYILMQLKGKCIIFLGEYEWLSLIFHPQLLSKFVNRSKYGIAMEYSAWNTS